MKVKSLISNSLRYSASDWYNLIILGIILFLLENLYILPGNPPGIDIYDTTVFFIIGILWILESGYIVQIIEETIGGSKKPPKFKCIKKTFVHGLKENITMFAYFSIPLIITGLIIVDSKIFLQLLELNPNIIFGYLHSSKTIYFALAIILSAFIYFWYLGVLINMGRNKGSMRSGFDLEGISLRLREAGIGNLLFVYFFIVFVATILIVAFSSTIETIPLNIYQFNVGDIIIQLLIAPYTIIFAFRMLGLLDYYPDKKNLN
jgi:hypothetical protein